MMRISHTFYLKYVQTREINTSPVIIIRFLVVFKTCHISCIIFQIVIDFNIFYAIIPLFVPDALDRERVSQHAQLRELVVRGDAAALKARLTALGTAGGIVANLTPGGANTLLYVWVDL